MRRKCSSDAAEIAALVESRNIGGFVAGLPLNMDGTEGPRVQSTRDLVAELLLRIDLPFAFQDERMSTRAVERAMIDAAELTRRQRHKARARQRADQGKSVSGRVDLSGR